MSDRRQPTTTSAFGVSGRSNHDASDSYARFNVANLGRKPYRSLSADVVASSRTACASRCGVRSSGSRPGAPTSTGKPAVRHLVDSGVPVLDLGAPDLLARLKALAD